MSYWIFSGGCVVFFGDAMFFVEGSRYVGLILFQEGLDLFFPMVELSFRILVLLLAAADLLFWPPPLVMANGDGGSYVWFNLQKIWSMCFRHPLLPTTVEHTAPLLRPPHLWSLLLVGTAVLFGSGVVPWRWSFLKQWTAPVARKMKDRDLVVCFNVILFYVEVSIVKEVIF